MTQSPLNVYQSRHSSKINLILHLFFVPLFMVGSILTIVLFFIQPFLSIIGFPIMAIAMGMQNIGHKLETNKPEPFTGPWDFIKRIFIEQWITFPKYFFSGKFVRILCSSTSDESQIL